jgi:hypothetical protein
MKKLKQFWKYFEGKKRNIGVVAIWVLRGTTLVFPKLLPMEHQMLIRDGIDILLLGGTVDAFRRTDKGKEIINKAIFKAK